MFKIHDLFGIGAAMLTLILVYLVLTHPTGASMFIGSGSSAVSNVGKMLQGR